MKKNLTESEKEVSYLLAKLLTKVELIKQVRQQQKESKFEKKSKRGGAMQ